MEEVHDYTYCILEAKSRKNSQVEYSDATQITQ